MCAADLVGKVGYHHNLKSLCILLTVCIYSQTCFTSAVLLFFLFSFKVLYIVCYSFNPDVTVSLSHRLDGRDMKRRRGLESNNKYSLVCIKLGHLCSTTVLHSLIVMIKLLQSGYLTWSYCNFDLIKVLRDNVCHLITNKSQ